MRDFQSIILAVLCCALLAPVSWARLAQLEQQDNPSRPKAYSASPAEGLTWELALPRSFTTLDGVTITSQLKNSSGGQIIWDTGEKMAVPNLVLTPKGKDPFVIPMRPHAGFNRQSGNHKPKPGEIVQGFTVDLRVFTGRIRPGEYTAHIVYPKDTFTIRHLPGFKPVDLVSPKVSFIVQSTTLADAQDAIPANQDLMFTTDARIVDKNDKAKVRHLSTGTVKNIGKQPVTFHAYTWGHEAGKPLSMIMNWNKWDPKHGWLDSQQLGWCGTGLGPYTLKPGESVKVILNNHMSDGVYRYQFNYSTADAPKKFKTAHSNAVHIDYFEQRFMKKQKNAS